jgi:hypothetical protein
MLDFLKNEHNNGLDALGSYLVKENRMTGKRRSSRWLGDNYSCSTLEIITHDRLFGYYLNNLVNYICFIR